MKKIVNYFIKLPVSKCILWCYLIWYLGVVVHYFDTDTTLWTSSLGIAFIVGCSLVLSTGGFTKERMNSNYWEISRLFLTPFFVSSFSAIIKDRGFILIFSPNPTENFLLAAACVAFIALVYSPRLMKGLFVPYR